MKHSKSVPSVTVTYAQNGNSTKSNELGMRAMQERAYEKRGEQYLLIKSPPASDKSRALMFIALDKLASGISPAYCSTRVRSSLVSRTENGEGFCPKSRFAMTRALATGFGKYVQERYSILVTPQK